MNVSSSYGSPYKNFQEEDKEIGRTDASRKRIISYDERTLGSLDKVRRVSDRSIGFGRKSSWTLEEKETIKRVASKFSISGPYLNKDFRKDPEIKQLGKSSKQISAHWVDILCPNSLGGSIQECHRSTIERLGKSSFGNWTAIFQTFSLMEFEGKNKGQYYSANTIKNYFNRIEAKEKRLKTKAEKDLKKVGETNFETIESSSSELVQGNDDEGRGSTLRTVVTQNLTPNFDEIFSNCLMESVEGSKKEESFLDNDLLKLL